MNWASPGRIFFRMFNVGFSSYPAPRTVLTFLVTFIPPAYFFFNLDPYLLSFSYAGLQLGIY
jgi:hypothetical protein